MPASTFYAAIKPKKDKHELIERRIIDIYHEHKGRYGVRRVALHLKSEGVLINHKTVHKLMRKNGLKSVQRRVRYNSYRGTVGKTAPNVINRNFTATHLYHRSGKRIRGSAEEDVPRGDERRPFKLFPWDSCGAVKQQLTNHNALFLKILYMNSY